MATTTDDYEMDALLIEEDTTNKKAVSKRKRILFGIVGLIIITTIIILAVVLTESDDSTHTNYEEIFLQSPSRNAAKANSKSFSEYPHKWGSEQNYIYAQDICNKMTQYGFHCEYYNYSVTLSHYVSSSLNLVNSTNFPSNTIYAFNLSEDIIDEDMTSDTAERHKAWMGWGKSGTVTANLIYLNYGRRADYKLLENELAFNFTQHQYIGIIKYGGGLSRHNKVRFAQLFGLKGVLLFGDPNDYLYNIGLPYPDGPGLPHTGYQRGSSAYTVKCVGAVEADRLLEKCNITQEEFLPQIPGIPISYDNAHRLMTLMHGNNVNDGNIFPSTWQGGLNFSYHTGVAGDAAQSEQVIINLNVETFLGEPESGNITHVISHMKGYKYTNESIFIGNHRDAWIYGGSDPVSGTTIILEIAKAFKRIVDAGWSPKRNIYIGSWDAEELSVVGSTTFVEDRADWISQQVVAYLNIDNYNGHNPSMSSDPLFAPFQMEYADRFKQPYDDSGVTVLDKWKENNPNTEYVDPLGYGSDYTAFVHSLGITSANFGFGGMAGCYHTVYDSFYFMDIIDENRDIAVVISQWLGAMAFHLANDDILPWNTTNLYNAISDDYIAGIETLINDWNCSLVGDNIKNQFRTNVDIYGDAAREFDAEIAILKINGNDDHQYEEKVIVYNGALRTLTRQFLYGPGLPTRIFYKNLLTANDMEAGYSAIPLPYIAFAVKYDCSIGMIQKAYNVTGQAILNAAKHLTDALDLFR